MTITMSQLSEAALLMADKTPKGQITGQLRDGTRLAFAGDGVVWRTIHTDIAVDLRRGDPEKINSHGSAE